MKKKKGFTLVELLVVIAILAILATVSVVGYMGFTKKAQVSNDESLVTQLNTALKADEAIDGKPETPTAMLEVMEENGFKVENLTPTTSQYNIVWNQEENQFALLDEQDGVVYGTLSRKTYMNWKFVDSYVDIEGFSYYLKGDKITGTFDNVKTGLDVGNNTIEEITYKGSSTKEALIRTNGGKLTINAGEDTVYHYGSADRVNIKAVAGESYHEYESVKTIVVEAGHAVLENNSYVKVLVINPSTNSKVSVDLKNENVVVYKTENATDENATINSENKVDTKTVNSANVDDVAAGVKDFDGGSGTEEDPYLIATGTSAYNIRNIKTKINYFKLVEDVVVTNEVYMSSGKTYEFDLNGHTIELKYADNVKPNNGSVFSIGGSKSKLIIRDTSENQTGKVLGDTRTYPNKVTSAIRVNASGTLEIYGGEFVGRSEGTSCIFTNATYATVKIFGGLFRTTTSYNGTYYVLNHNDRTTSGSKMIVSGGTFVNYNPGVTVVDPDNAKTGKITLGDGCTTTSKTVGKDTYYTVTKAN